MLTRNILDQLKSDCPSAYWRACDMAAEGKSAAAISREVYQYVICANEKRALQGMARIALPGMVGAFNG